MTKDITAIIEKGVAFIAREQQKDGGFLCLTTTREKDFSHADTVRAIVPPNIILSCLNALEETETVCVIKKKVAGFLLTQKSAYWSFNYWFRNSPESAKLPYPDDMDDTFCALAALQVYDPTIIDGEALGKITTILTAAEESAGGPYDMWITRPEDKDRWKRIDLVVNSNIAYFLSLNDVTLPRVTKFIEASIDREDYVFPYCSIYPAIYFISRFYRGKKVPKIIDTILAQQKKDGSWGNPLQTALALLSLFNFSAKVPSKMIQRGIDHLLKTQKRDGSWCPYAFYVELQTKEKNHYAGSAALTTAFCLEAIHRSNTKDQISNIKKEVRGREDPQNALYRKIIKTARARFATLDNDLQKQFAVVLKRVRKMDKDKHIILLPYLFFKSLRADMQQKLAEGNERDGIIAALCRANLYGWIAYTIYDDFLDEEGDPRALSVATLCLREITTIFERLAPENPAIAQMFHRVMDTIDAANAWETSNCRDKELKCVPDYGDLARLADRSLGHSLGPVSILILLGYDGDAPETRALTEFFTHYLIARQLNDDAHDWEDDLKKGHINAVGARILKKARATDIARAQRGGDYTALESIFWHTVIDDVCAEITRRARKARKAITRIRSVADPALFSAMIAGPEAMVAKTKKEKTDTLKFLKVF